MSSKSASGNVWETLLCGGIAGCVAKTAIAPFDRVKIHFQVQNPALRAYSGRLLGVFEALSTIYKATGISGLFRGHSAMLMRIFPYAAINYLSYEKCKVWVYNGQQTQNVVWWKRIAAGSMAGCTAVTLTYPLDILRVRLAFDLTTRNRGDDNKIRGIFDRYVGRIRSSSAALSSEGKSLHGVWLAGHYQGYLATVAGIIPYAGVSYSAFETQKSMYRRYFQKDPCAAIPIIWKLPMGMVSGALAQTAAYPLDVVRRRIQILSVAPYLRKSYGNRPSAIKILISIVNEHGIRGLFTGLSINYLKVAPATGISFVVYEFLRENLFHLPIN